MAIYITGDIHGNPERITRQQIIDLFYKYHRIMTNFTTLRKH